jgi:hypothetical protein
MTAEQLVDIKPDFISTKALGACFLINLALKVKLKSKNKDEFITINWQDDFETSSRFIYYGVGSRNEYRLTRFGRGFPFLRLKG